jgi:hypothetical protein
MALNGAMGTAQHPLTKLTLGSAVQFQEVTSDPASPQPGQWWYRSDEDVVGFYNGNQIRYIPGKDPSNVSIAAFTVNSSANGERAIPLTTDVANAPVPSFSVVYGGEEYVPGAATTVTEYTEGENGLGGENLMHTETWETNDLASYSLQHDESWENN